MATKKDTAAEVLAKIATWDEPFRGWGQRLHEVILAAHPDLKPKLFYGMPGYATKGPVLCFFRYDDDLMTFGLSEKAHHAVAPGAADQLMASSWFLRDLDAATEKRIAEIVAKAVR